MVARPFSLGSRRSSGGGGERLRSFTSTPVSEESTVVTHPCLALARLGAAQFASNEDRVARLLRTEREVVIMKGEAMLPLEGASRCTAGAGTTALNVITGPYGQTFGNW